MFLGSIFWNSIFTNVTFNNENTPQKHPYLSPTGPHHLLSNTGRNGIKINDGVQEAIASTFNWSFTYMGYFTLLDSASKGFT